MARSLKQKWQQKRVFLNYGSLHSIQSRLTGLIHDPTTLNAERNTLREALRHINFVLGWWRVKNETSWDLYRRDNE